MRAIEQSHPTDFGDASAEFVAEGSGLSEVSVQRGRNYEMLCEQ